jgi:bifunctional ADP-heptose synthase (sugar kinase/adenylyltransferase)
MLVDPKIPHIDHYAGATLITPNHHEVEQATTSAYAVKRTRVERRACFAIAHAADAC